MKADTGDFEEWRQVPGHEGWYEVSSFGRVRRASPGRSTTAGKVLKQTTRYDGFRQVALVKGSRASRTTQYVHNLVARAFIGDITTGYTVNHKDFDRANNTPGNLEIITAAANKQHAWEHGRIRKGETHQTAKLTEAQVRAAIALRGTTTIVSIARLFHVSESAIRDIFRGRNWKHIK